MTEWINILDERPEPVNGDKILGYAGYAFECECEDGQWCNIGGETMSHWMPLPDPPRLESHIERGSDTVHFEDDEASNYVAKGKGIYFRDPYNLNLATENKELKKELAFYKSTRKESIKEIEANAIERFFDEMCCELSGTDDGHTFLLTDYDVKHLKVYKEHYTKDLKGKS